MEPIGVFSGKINVPEPLASPTMEGTFSKIIEILFPIGIVPVFVP